MTVPRVATPPPAAMPTKALAMSSACCASEAEFTLPERTSESPTAFTSNRPLGRLCCSDCRSTLMSRAMVTSSAAICRPSASITKIEVAPLSMPIRNSLRLERTTALATAGLATNTSLASRGKSMMSERPLLSSTFRETAVSFGPIVRTGEAPGRPGCAEAGPDRVDTARQAPESRRRAGPRKRRAVVIVPVLTGAAAWRRRIARRSWAPRAAGPPPRRGRRSERNPGCCAGRERAARPSAPA